MKGRLASAGPNRARGCYDRRLMMPVESPALPALDPSQFVPIEVGRILNHQTDLPRIARDPALTARIDARLREIPTVHHLYCHDSRRLDFLEPESLHLVVTSPPYNIGVKYRSYQDDLPRTEYLNWTDRWMRAVARVVTPDSSFFL